MKTKFSSYLFIFVIVIAMGSCSKSSSYVAPVVTPPAATPGANDVWMQNTAFTPASKTVTVGTTITWTNKDNVSHDVTSSTAGLFTSPTMGKDATFSYKFDVAGTYGYKCTFHPGMSGTIIVQ